MNKIVLFLLLSVIAVSCKNKSNTEIQGQFRNTQKNSLKLEYLDINKTILIDSIGLKKDGSFSFKLTVDQPGLYILRNEDGKIISLLVSPGEDIRIEGDYKDFDRHYSVMGSTESEFIRQLVEKLNDTRAQFKMLDSTYKADPSVSGDKIAEYLKHRKDIIKEQRDFSISFIIEHLSSVASIYALYQKLNPEELVLSENKDIQYMKIVADSLSVKYPGSSFVTSFVHDARAAETRYNNLIGLQKKMKQAEAGIPDISFPDPSGAIRNLSSLKGKIVLLYFWSVYSDESKKQNPVFERIYRKYKNKGFEIFAVCLDTKPDNWLKMIKFDELSFINTFGPEFVDSPASRIYNLQAVPANYLLDREGNILARNLYGSELEKWLDNKL